MFKTNQKKLAVYDMVMILEYGLPKLSGMQVTDEVKEVPLTIEEKRKFLEEFEQKMLEEKNSI